jgi:hypothetical protein
MTGSTPVAPEGLLLRRYRERGDRTARAARGDPDAADRGLRSTSRSTYRQRFAVRSR